MPSPSPSLQSPSFPSSSVVSAVSSSLTTSSLLTTAAAAAAAAAASVEDYPAVRCCVYVFESSAKPNSGQVFRECALRYQVAEAKTARALSDICDHNANVAASLGRIQVATIWRMVKLLFGSVPCLDRPITEAQSSSSTDATGGTSVTAAAIGDALGASSVLLLGKDSSSSSAAAATAGGGGSGGGSSRHQSGGNNSAGGQDISTAVLNSNGAGGGGSGGSGTQSNLLLSNNDRSGGGFPSDTFGGVSEEAESEAELDSMADVQERTLSHIASGFNDLTFRQTDFLFGDVDADALNEFHLTNGHQQQQQHHHHHQNGPLNRIGGSGGRSSSSVPPLPQQQQRQQQQSDSTDWILPSEAFQPRHEIKDRSPPPEHFTSRCFAESSRIGK